MFSSRAKKSKAATARDFVWPRIGLGRAWRYRLHRLARIRATPHALALGFAAGAFASFQPFIGLHFIIALLLAWVMRANLLASALGTILGNPITFPIIWLASYDTGAVLLGEAGRTAIDLHGDSGIGLWSSGPTAFFRMLWSVLEPILLPLTLGGTVLGLLAAAISYVAIRKAVERLQAAMLRRRAATR